MGEKYKTILDNYINGNLLDFKKGLKGLNKKELLEFVFFWSGENMENTKEILVIISRYI